jgi:predicted amidohydrolase YtcJ
LVSNYWKKWQELKMVPEYKDVNLRIHGIKCWSDGSTQAGSAYLREDYLVKEWGKGAANYTASSLYSSIKAAHDAGWQVGVHSNGDAAIDMTLDALAAVQK